MRGSDHEIKALTEGLEAKTRVLHNLADVDNFALKRRQFNRPDGRCHHDK
jgi:hypothetical protein